MKPDNEALTESVSIARIPGVQPDLVPSPRLQYLQRMRNRAQLLMGVSAAAPWGIALAYNFLDGAYYFAMLASILVGVVAAGANLLVGFLQGEETFK